LYHHAHQCLEQHSLDNNNNIDNNNNVDNNNNIDNNINVDNNNNKKNNNINVDNNNNNCDIILPCVIRFFNVSKSCTGIGEAGFVGFGVPSEGPIKPIGKSQLQYNR